MRLVFVEHGHRIGAVQLQQRGFDRLKQIALVQAVHQVGDDFGVGLAGKHIAFGLQRGAQGVVVFDDAVVHQRHARGAVGLRRLRAVAEMRVGVAHRRRAMGGPARVGNAGAAFSVVCLYLRHQFGHPVGAARPAQAAR